MMANLSGFERRKRRSRYQLKRCAKGRLRLSVFRSGKHMYAQIIDDAQRVTLVSASTLERDLRPAMGKSADCAAAAVVGKILAERAQKSGVNQVVFDRGAYVYHGRVKALADAARGAGLQF